MGYNDCCCCCCCEKPKFKKCKQTVYVPECMDGLGGYGNYPASAPGYGYGGFDGGCGFGGGGIWWLIIILLIFCGGFGNNGCGCGNNGCGFGNC
ncbi:ground-like protein [Clostridium sardiniense]